MAVIIAERRRWEDAVPVRRRREEIRGRFRRDCNGVLRALPPGCDGRHRQTNQALAALHRPLPQLRHSRFRRGPCLQVTWGPQGV